MLDNDFFASKVFNSLQDCVKFIQDNFPENKLIQIEAKDLDTGESFSSAFPAHFYRGEKKCYPTSTSSLYRIATDDLLSQIMKEKIASIAKAIDLEFQEFANISPILSEAYLQHYGLPTTLLDITSHLDIAAYFASCGNVGDIGLICVFNYDDMDSDTNIIDLRNHRFAQRPKWQHAFGFSHNIFSDLKKSDCIERLALKWFSFALTQTDIAKFKVKDEILDAHRDMFAGQIQIIVDNFEKQEDSMARWLADNIVPASFVTKVNDYWDSEHRQPKTGELVSMEEAGMLYNEVVERENNYKKWSEMFPEIRPHKLL
jgi:hypothetical protein